MEEGNFGTKSFMSYSGSLCNRPPYWVGSVWKKYSYRIYKLCLQKCGEKDEADDLFQEVALRFCQKANELNNGIRLLPWFQTVLLNCHYSEYRKRNMNRAIPISSLCESKQHCYNYEENLLSDNGINPNAIIGEFSCLLSVLSPLEKMIVEFTIVGGFTSSELSELIGLSKAGITRRRLKAYQKMHEKMEMQKEQLKMVVGREVTLREIIEYAG